MAYPVSNSLFSERSSEKKAYNRFDLWQRFSHIIMLTSFTVLAATGLPQKFADAPISLFIMSRLGGIEPTRQIHHVAAAILLLVSMYHILDVLYRILVLRATLSMLPWITDFQHLFQDLAYFLGFRKHRAYYGRFSYVEKVEYLALVWGTVIMALTGFAMWNPLATTSVLPGEVIPAAKAAHGGEAILAVLAIFVWHFTHVHFPQFNKSMFTGKLTEEQMKHEHPAELDQIENYQAWERPPTEIIRKRQRVFYPIAAVLTVILGLGLVGFITIENTSPVTTVPQGETAAIFVPLTPTPRPTAIATPTIALPGGVSPNSWNGSYQALFRNRCGTCHGVTSVSGLSLATYQSALKGGTRGPAIVPGNPDASILVQIQSAGNHPGQLTIDELNQIIAWIKSGAPER
jgi:formate dehydrogenase subunit gamma